MRTAKRKCAVSFAEWHPERRLLNERIFFTYIGFSASSITTSDYPKVYNDSFRFREQKNRWYDGMVFILCLFSNSRFGYFVPTTVSVVREHTDDICD